MYCCGTGSGNSVEGKKMDDLGKLPDSFHTQLGSGKATGQSALLTCVIASVATNGDSIEVYNGRDSTSGSKILKLVVLANASVSFNISQGVLCDKGIYVACSETTVEWSIFFKHIPLEL